MNIELRPIQSDSVIDKENYLALQKSVALFPQMRFENKKEIELMKEYQNQGIGYQSIVIMLNKLVY